MKITIYTITECAFSKQEKEYLATHTLQFEEKNLETNREFLTEMLTVGSNFAGTPVTKIEKDDGQIVVLKGFTPAEFDKALGFTPNDSSEKKEEKGEEVKKDAEAKPIETAQAESPTETVSPPVETIPEVKTPPTATAPTPQTETPPAAPITDDPAMASVLNNLQQQAQSGVAEVAPAETPSAPPSAPPSTDEPQAPASGQPVIPDPQF